MLTKEAEAEEARIWLRVRSLIRRPAKEPGAAVTIVPGVADGGGVGEDDRKSGWMWSSFVKEGGR
jgi:hypothetical protein